MKHNSIIENNLLILSRLSGIGTRSSKRILLDLMKKKDSLLIPLINNLTELSNNIHTCSECNNIDVTNPCAICASEKRDKTTLCIVEEISSLWAIEKSRSYNGLYFVLGGVLSAIKNNIHVETNLQNIINSIKSNSHLKEVIIATSSTIEGQITANYIKDEISSQVDVSMLAQGIPVGGEIDYLDDITISTAINLRKHF